MLKRLAAFFFIFVVAGQVSAGVCGCLVDKGQPQHSCCRHKRSAKDAIRQKGCCDNDCSMRQAERVAQDRTNTTVKISLKAVAQPALPKLENFAPLASETIAKVTATADHRLKYSRPPELYLRHHAFLI